MSNIQKLFSERIEIFSSVEFSKVSVLTGIIKISLKVRQKLGLFCSFSYSQILFPSRNVFPTGICIMLKKLEHPVPSFSLWIKQFSNLPQLQRQDFERDHLKSDKSP